jgi:uncharacterized protein
MNTFQKSVAVVVGVVGVIFVVGSSYLSSLVTIEGKVRIEVNNQSILAEVSDTPRTRTQGLSGRDSLGINEGMLFVFDGPGSYGFWMKDMEFSIDIVWISGNEIVGISEYVPVPARDYEGREVLETYYPPEPVDRVLELSAGRVRLLRANVGDELRIQRFGR